MQKIICCICVFVLCTTHISLQAQEKNTSATNYLKEGKQLLFYGKYGDATQAFQKALEISEKSQDFQLIADSYNELAQAYFFQSQLMQSYTAAQKALVFSEKAETLGRQSKAKALESLSTIESIMGEAKVALENASKALEIRLQYFENEKLSLVHSYFKLAVALHANRKLPEAFKNLDIALAIKAENTPELAILHADIYELKGHMNYDLGENGKALKYFEKTFQLAKDTYEKTHPYFGKVYNDFGLIYSMREEFNESLEYYKKALSLSIQNYGVDNHDEQVRIHFNIGTVYHRQNLKEKALHHTFKTLELGTKFYGEDHIKMYYPYSQIGNIYGDERGIPYLKKALAICLKAQKVNNVIASYQYEYLGDIHRKIGKHKEAIAYFDKALQIRQKVHGMQNVNTIKTFNNIAKVYTSLNDFEKALSYNETAIINNQLTDINDANRFSATSYVDVDMPLETTKTKADILFSLYEKTKEKKYLKQSNAYYKEAISYITLTRNEKRNHEDKIKFSEIIKALYAKNIASTLLLYDLDKTDTSLKAAFTDSEKSKSHVLRALLKNAEMKRNTNIHEDILSLEKELNTKLASIQSAILQEATAKNSDTVKLYALEGTFFDLSKQKDSLEKNIEANLPKYYKLKYEDDVIAIETLQEKLNDKTTLLEFFKDKETLYAFVITKNSFHVEKLFIEDLDTRIKTLNNAIVSKDKKQFTNNALYLYHQILVPIKKHFVGDELIIIPDESLWYLQFDLLLTKDTDTLKPAYLLHDYAISYANSATLLFEETVKSNTQDLQNDCIAFSFTSKDSIQANTEMMALSDLRNSHIDLPGTRREITEISKILEGSYFYGNNANETNFKQYADQFKIIHLALHGDIDNQHSNNLKIYFSEGSTEDDDKLFLHELYNLHIPANLVVLSACNTGSGKLNKAEGIQSLGNAFQYAGAKSLLLSKWEISDKTTPEFMGYFYKHIKAGLPKHKALQQAKIDFLATADTFNAAPFYWGSFYVLGNTDAITFTTNSYYSYWIIGISILLILVLVFLFNRKLKFK